MPEYPHREIEAQRIREERIKRLVGSGDPIFRSQTEYEPLPPAEELEAELTNEYQDFLGRQGTPFERRMDRIRASFRNSATEAAGLSYNVADNLYNFLISINAERIAGIDLSTPSYLLGLVRKAGQILVSGKLLYGAGNSLYQFVRGSDEDLINEAYDGFVNEVINSGRNMPADIENNMKRLNTSAKLLASNPYNQESQSLFNKNLKEAIYINFNEMLKTSRQLNDYSPEAMKKRVLGNFDGRREIYLNRPDISDLGIVPNELYKY